LDLNHTVSSKFRLLFNKYNAVAIEDDGLGHKVARGERWALQQLEVALLRHIRWFVHAEFGTEEYKSECWFGAEDYFTGEDRDWKLKANPQARAQLHGFLHEFYTSVLPKLQDELATSECESLNAMKARFAPKQISFARSLLCKNKGWDWPIHAWSRFGFEDLSQKSIERLQIHARKCKAVAALPNTWEGRRKQAEAKLKRRARKAEETVRGRQEGHTPPATADRGGRAGGCRWHRVIVHRIQRSLGRLRSTPCPKRTWSRRSCRRAWSR
jgi:hypothetical protein